MFHYFRNKDSIPSQYLFSKFCLKLPLEKLTKENNNEKFHVLSLFLSHVLGLKSICKSHWTLSINPRKKAFDSWVFYVWYLQLSSMALHYWIHYISQNAREHLIDKLLERMGGTLSPKILTLPTLIVIDTVKLEMHLSANITWSHDRWVTWLDGCDELSLCHTLLKLVVIALAKVEIKLLLANHVITWSMSHVTLCVRYPHSKSQRL